MQGIILPPNAKVSAVRTLPGNYVIDREGDVAIVIDLTERSDQHMGLLTLTGARAMESRLLGGRHGLPKPDVIGLEFDEIEVVAKRATRTRMDDLKIGSIIVAETGTHIVAKSWDENADGPMYVNVHTGKLSYVNEAIVFSVTGWTIRGLRAAKVVAEIGPATPSA
ncbi:MAG: hypothetical protein WBW32_03130 [Luteibacter sp.]